MDDKMNDNFVESVEFVLANEGGYSDNPADPGGPTNFGISERFLESIDNDIHPKDLNREQAIAIYKAQFWEKNHLQYISSLRIAKKLFDMVVNMGAHQAIILLQRAYNYTHDTKLTVDGLLGGSTIGALNKLMTHDINILIANLKLESAKFYKQLVVKNPANRVFLNGWLTRSYCG